MKEDKAVVAGGGFIVPEGGFIVPEGGEIPAYKEPVRSTVFIQYDGHTNRKGSIGDWTDGGGNNCVVSDPYDDDGDAINASDTVESMWGAAVRVLILPSTSKDDIVRLLRKIATWVEDHDHNEITEEQEKEIKGHDNSGVGMSSLLGRLQNHTWCGKCDGFMEDINSNEPFPFICRNCRDFTEHREEA